MERIDLTLADIAAAKAACFKRFGHDRIIGIDYADPITGEQLVTVLIADLTLADASAYFDARVGGIPAARSTLLTDRILFPVVAALEEIREAWPEFDRSVEAELRTELGFFPGNPTVAPLALLTAPPGLSAALVPAMLAAAEGTRLWAISRPANGLACVLRQPQAAIYHLSQASYAEAWLAKRGILTSWLDIVGDHCVWSPAATLRAHLEQRPGRLEDIGVPWQQMGGQGAKTSARRF